MVLHVFNTSFWKAKAATDRRAWFLKHDSSLQCEFSARGPKELVRTKSASCAEFVLGAITCKDTTQSLNCVYRE